MCDKLLSIIKEATKSLQEISDSAEILKQLKEINERLEHLEKTLLFRFQLTIGISFIGLALGATYASFEYQWLSIVLLIGGLTIIFWARIEYSGYTRAKAANIGLSLTIIGLLSAVVHLIWKANVPPIFFFIGLILIMVGFFLMTVASRPIRPNSQR